MNSKIKLMILLILGVGSFHNQSFAEIAGTQVIPKNRSLGCKIKIVWNRELFHNEDGPGDNWDALQNHLVDLGAVLVDDSSEDNYLIAVQNTVLQRDGASALKWSEVMVTDSNKKLVFHIIKHGPYNADNLDKALTALDRRLARMGCISPAVAD